LESNIFPTELKVKNLSEVEVNNQGEKTTKHRKGKGLMGTNDDIIDEEEKEND
jgi:hypothetical protein